MLYSKCTRALTFEDVSAGGCATVLGIIAVCVGGTHGSVAAGMDGALATGFLIAIWVEAAVAL
jgi:outer membrane lipoprotein SlyB